MTNKTNWISDNHITNKFNFKKKDAEERGVEFNLTRKEWKFFWRTSDGTCDFTGMKLTIDVGFPNTASVDRLDPCKGYELGNICIVRSDCNLLKSYCLETKVDSRDITITKDQKALIKKMCETLYDKDKMGMLKKKYLLPVEKSELLEEKVITQSTTNILTEDEDVNNSKWSTELSYAKHYIALVEEFNACGVQVKITLGTLKKIILRVKKDQLTGVPFSTLEEKVLFVVDKSKPITPCNIKVVSRSTRVAMDMITKGCSSILPKLALNLHKIQSGALKNSF